MSPTRVLVVDDHPLNVELVTFLLEAADMVVDTASDASGALLRIPAFKPDVILMDIQLPGMDGLALTQVLKADAATAHIVIVAFTAYAMKGDEARMRQAGCDGYIAKPIDVASFVGQLRACMQAVGAGTGA
jgi:two-component system cell cycle response regulator DivK